MFYSPSVSRCPCWAACFRKRVQRYANFPVRQNAARFFLRFCCIFIAYRGISGRFCGIVCCFPAFDMLYSILQGHWEGWFSGPAFPKKMKMKMQYATLYHKVYKKMGPFMRQAQKTCPPSANLPKTIATYIYSLSIMTHIRWNTHGREGVANRPKSTLHLLW